MSLIFFEETLSLDIRTFLYVAYFLGNYATFCCNS